MEKILENTIDNQHSKYNTKVKSYRDGSCTVIYCNNHIFSPKTQVTYIDDDDYSVLDVATVGKIKKQNTRKAYGEKCFPEKRERTDSMKRAIDKIYDIAFQNEWVYFITCTFSEDCDFSRYSGKEIIQPLNDWLRNRVKRFGLQYMIVPEYHKESNGIHLHGLINAALPLEYSGRRLYSGKAWQEVDLLKRGVDITQYKQIYNIPSWKYGYTTAILVTGSPAALACYITKYCTKDTQKIFGKFYLSSRNIIRDTDLTFANTDDFKSIDQKPIFKCGNQFKYQSDFIFGENKERNPTDEILTYLSERGAL